MAKKLSRSGRWPLVKLTPDILATYKLIPGFEDYLLNRDGEVLSIRVLRTLEGYARPIRSVKHSKQNVFFIIRSDVQRSKPITVARALLLTFVGPPPMPQCKAVHLNGDINDDSLDNLAWGVAITQPNKKKRLRH